MSENKFIKNDLKSLIEKFSKDDVITSIEKNYQKDKVQFVHVNDIVDNKIIKSAKIDEKTIKNIEKSIIEHGLYNPLIVRNTKNGKFEIVIGRKRWIACKKLNYSNVPIIVNDYSDQETLLILLCDSRENKNFNPIEVALIINALTVKFDYKKGDIAEILHQSPSQISNYLSLLTLPSPIIYDVSTNKLSFGHAKALAHLENEKEIMNIVNKIYDFNLSVRETENLVYSLKDESTKYTKNYVLKKKENTIIIQVNKNQDDKAVYNKINDLLKNHFKKL